MPSLVPILATVTFTTFLLLFVLAMLVILVNVVHIVVRSITDPSAECASRRLQYQWAGLYVLAISASITWSFYYGIPPAFLLTLDFIGAYLYFRGGSKRYQNEQAQEEPEE